MLDKDLFLDCMRKLVKKMNQQEQLIQVLVDDLKMRNHEGVLYLRGERMYSTRDVTQRLRICERTMDRIRKSGELPFIMLHNKAYYKESDIITLIENTSKKIDRKAAGEFLAQAKVNLNINI